MIRKKISIIFITVLLLFTIFEILNQKQYKTYFAVLPHFSIEENIINAQYKNIKETYNISGKNLQILIISPDHYKVMDDNIIKLKTVDKEMCYKGNYMNIKWIYWWKEDIDEKYIQEHGWWEHFLYIKKYFSGSDIYLARLQWRNFNGTESILKELKQLEKKGNLLVLASVDFSHYVEENRANIHDIKTKYVMQNSLKQIDYENIEVDCPLCLYITNLWANEKNQYPNFIFRDSSSTINKKDLWYDNTSRQWYLYGDKKDIDNWITLAFFWDLIFDRWVEEKLWDDSNLIEHFKDWYQLWDYDKIPEYNIHRKGFGIDLIWFNLETPYVEENCNQTFGKINFCSSGNLIPLLSSLWFSFVTISNNHILDAGIQWYEETKNILTKNTIDYAWYIKTNSLSDNNVILKSVRGTDVAIHWYNFYNRFSWDLNTYCDILNDYKNNKYINIVSAHRWNEYENIHNKIQENIWKRLIDCGADVILWHHPHVIQDIQWYKNKPIIYSLGNFLFDQYLLESTKKWMYVLIDINMSWDIQLRTGEIKSTP